MENRIKNILKTFILISLVMFQFFGCKQVEDLKDSEKVAYIAINSTLARTVNPEASIEKMTNFVLIGTFSGEEEQKLGSWDNAKALKNAKIPIKPGLWDFKLTAQQVGISFSAAIEKKQIEVALNNLEFDLSISSMDSKKGKGCINISFTGLKNTVNSVIARAFYLDGKEANDFYTYLKVDSTGEKNTATLNVSDVPSGIYLIYFEFYTNPEYKVVDNFTNLGTYTELVNVVADCTSSALIENLDLDTHLYKLTYNLNGGIYNSAYIFYVYKLPASYSSSSNVDLSRLTYLVYKHGYALEGWYLESPDELFDGNFQGMTGDKTLYAKWKPGKCEFYIDSYYFDYSKNQWESLYEKQKCYGISEEQLTEERIKEIVSSNDEYKGYVFDHVENLGTISPKRSYDDTVKLYVRPVPSEIVLKLNGGNINGNTGDITISGYYNQNIDYYIEEPELDGLFFEKWSPSIPKTFPLEKTEHTASYNSIGKFVEYNDYTLAETELTYKAWYSVYQWAISEERGRERYSFKNPGREGSNGVDGAAPTENSNEPVTNITYNDALIWCNAASEKDGLIPAYYKDYKKTYICREYDRVYEVDSRCILNENSYHLPSIEEWKLMAKGTSLSEDSWAGTNSFEEVNDYAVTALNSGGKTAAVKTKKANSIGLYDMSGNVWEYLYYYDYGYNTIYGSVRGGSYKNGDATSYPNINFEKKDVQYYYLSYLELGDLTDFGMRVSKSKK